MLWLVVEVYRSRADSPARDKLKNQAIESSEWRKNLIRRLCYNLNTLLRIQHVVDKHRPTPTKVRLTLVNFAEYGPRLSHLKLDQV